MKHRMRKKTVDYTSKYKVVLAQRPNPRHSKPLGSGGTTRPQQEYIRRAIPPMDTDIDTMTDSTNQKKRKSKWTTSYVFQDDHSRSREETSMNSER